MPVTRFFRSFGLAALSALAVSVQAQTSRIVSLGAPGGIAPASRSLSDEVFYFYMPIAWRSGNGGLDGDFKGMADSLPYLQSLGVTAVWMTPIHPSPAYHGYQYSDGGAVNSRFGTEDDFRAFVHQAHVDGIRVFIDLVAYGVGTASLYFGDAYNNPASSYSNWFKWYDTPHTSYEGYSYPTWDGDTVGFAWWNLNDPGPFQVEKNWCLKWLNPNYGAYSDAGVDGFRVDHAVDSYDAYGPNGLGYTIANFWNPFVAALKAQYPKVVLFGEQGDWGLYGNTFLPPFDATFTKPLEFAARDTLSGGAADSFMHVLAETVLSLGSSGTYLGTFGDHDVDRLTSVIGDNLSKAKLAAGLLMAQPYAPIIYYGDEIGMRGFKSGAYNSDANDIPNREPFKWNAVAGPPMSNYYSVNSDVYNNRYEHDNDGRSVQEETGVAGSLLETYRQLIGIRKAQDALKHGVYEPIASDNDSVISFVRRSAGAGIICVFNLSDAPVTTHLNLGAYIVVGPAPKDLISGSFFPLVTPSNQESYAVDVPADGTLYLKMLLSPTDPSMPRVDGQIPVPDLTVGRTYQNQASTISNAELDAGLYKSDARYKFISGGSSGGGSYTRGSHLYLGFPGTLPQDESAVLAVLVEAADGGEDTLDLTNFGDAPAGVSQLNGMKMPAGFHPNALAIVNCYGNSLYADWFSLPGAGLGVHTYRGTNFCNRLIGGLLGGANSSGMRAGALNESIPVGTAFTDVHTGVELSLNLGDIPGAVGSGHVVQFLAFLLRNDGRVSNQLIPALPSPSGDLGIAPDLSAISGCHAQSVTGFALSP